MASKKKNGKTKTPAVRYLRYELTNSGTPGTETSHYIDLAKDLSSLNRRLYRQGRDYHVRRITVVSSNTPALDSRISVSTCPDSWVARNAWKRGFETWKRMNEEGEIQTSGLLAGTWSDFKVYLSDSMRSGTKLTPMDNGGNTPSTANTEWLYSKFVTSEGTTTHDEFLVHLLGDHNGSSGSRTSVGLIKSYGESRSTVNYPSPDVPADAKDDPLLNVFNYGETIDVVVDNLAEDNDRPPYSQSTYPGDDANMPKPLVVHDTTLNDGKAIMGGFNAICGLLEIESKSPIASDVYSVLVELAPGNYRGVAADVI